MMTDDLWRRSATELARMIADGEATSRQVVEAHLARIEAVNPHLNAVVLLLADQALAAADTADAADIPTRGPLHGVPFTVKENIDLAGTPTTQGVHALAEAVAPLDAPVVERMRAAGAIPIGRTNLPDFALRIHTDSSLHGLTRNPWDPTVTAGGSSGGEASALAAGLTPLGLGNDIGGSLRNPAHCCGITSIKPTTGRVPHATVIPPEDGSPAVQLMAVQGVMARTVADVRLGLSVVAGASPRDPVSVPVPLDIGGIASRRVALVPEPPGGDTHPEIAAAVRRAGDVLASAGYDVVEAVPPAYEESLQVWGDWLMADLRVQGELLHQVMGADAITFLDGAAALYADSTVGGYVTALVRRHAIQRAWSEFFLDTPLVVSPVWTQPPFSHSWDLTHVAETLSLLRPVMPANVLGLPAAAVPVGLAAGLPVGVQVIGERFSELACLDAAGALEAAGLAKPTPIEPVTG